MSLDPNILSTLASINWHNFEKDVRTAYLLELRRVEEEKSERVRVAKLVESLRAAGNCPDAIAVYLAIVKVPQDKGQIHCGLESYGLHYSFDTINMALIPHKRFHAGIDMDGGRGRHTVYFLSGK